jgi:hypothetical protein
MKTSRQHKIMKTSCSLFLSAAVALLSSACGQETSLHAIEENGLLEAEASQSATSEQNAVPQDIQYTLATGLGDFNQDARINGLDFDVLMGCYTQTILTPACMPGDMNQDRRLDQTDFALFIGLLSSSLMEIEHGTPGRIDRFPCPLEDQNCRERVQQTPEALEVTSVTYIEIDLVDDVEGKASGIAATRIAMSALLDSIEPIIESGVGGVNGLGQ